MIKERSRATPGRGPLQPPAFLQAAAESPEPSATLRRQHTPEELLEVQRQSSTGDGVEGAAEPPDVDAAAAAAARGARWAPPGVAALALPDEEGAG